MYIVTHHHPAQHAATQPVVAHSSASLNTLPPWTHSPIFLTFAPCFVVLVLLMIRHRHNLYRRGERLTTRKTKPVEYIALALLGGGLFYLRDKFPIIPLILEWPDRTFPYYHEIGRAHV